MTLMDAVRNKTEPFFKPETPAVRRKVEPFFKRKDRYEDRDVIVIPPLKRPRPLKQKMLKCGECGAMFEAGKPTFYSCMKPMCPMFNRVYMWQHQGPAPLQILCGSGDGMSFGSVA